MQSHIISTSLRIEATPPPTHTHFLQTTMEAYFRKKKKFVYRSVKLFVVKMLMCKTVNASPKSSGQTLQFQRHMMMHWGAEKAVL